MITFLYDNDKRDLHYKYVGIFSNFLFFLFYYFGSGWMDMRDKYVIEST